MNLYVDIKWVWLIMFFGAVWFGYELAESADPVWLKVECFMPAGLLAFFFAMEMDWIK